MASARTCLVAAYTLALAYCGTAIADQPPTRGGSGWSVGIGAVGSTGPYPDSSTDITPIPFLGYDNGTFYWRGLAAGLRTELADGVEGRGYLRGRMQRRRASDSDVLEGTKDRSRTLEAGVGISAGPRWLRGSLDVSGDLLSQHSGQEVRASVTVPWLIGDWVVLSSVGANWQSAEFANYYYGVRTNEIGPDRPAYEPGSSLNPSMAISLIQRSEGRTGWFIRIEHEWLDSNIQDSPIIDSGHRWSGIAAFTYRL
ncbi:hypothetical protein CAI21_04435 [Alkalilimnicola ehrlichii]|uniref:MltA-interacting MipA family protein n=1 Tax=Alkalilimnicola ehrlichii TaxID=351052 RepID=A0A3E0WZ87_9GAMM|nr:MipA/OmpV family protein [Alkalilimnicola ehrlichii]RFA30762.1 hypothetical protein CAI21_04435 [Alkalilimnicola ehrlichii]RFA38338.1 hypothetical protein CAL65_05800 [Alkalilimnicola ehrlichii]